MEPFDSYPHRGRVPLSAPRTGDGTCRRGYGLDFQKKTGQTTCAYRGVNLVDDYYHWLLMALDHVIPVSACRNLRIPPEYGGDCINLVLACSGCNGFLNRFSVPPDVDMPRESPNEWTLEEFVALRDEIFRRRCQQIAERKAKEVDFYRSRPWTVGT